MARLVDLAEGKNLDNDIDKTDSMVESFVESLTTLIEMVQDDALNEEELDILNDTIEFISEDIELDEDEVLDEGRMLKKMSAKDLKASRVYRRKNKGKLKIQAKKRRMKLKKFAAARKKCLVKIAGKEGYGCNSKGKVYRKKERK